MRGLCVARESRAALRSRWPPELPDATKNHVEKTGREVDEKSGDPRHGTGSMARAWCRPAPGREEHGQKKKTRAVGLHVCVLGAEQFPGPVKSQTLHVVDIPAPVAPALAGVSLGSSLSVIT